ncbi:uncharacterized protein [Coffea arabica]|uniref:Uncharacterized protein isoform X1 n=1 Tax=Coffea arabica TaxID=13443 RepID=A0ABM4UDK8_COFAR
MGRGHSESPPKVRGSPRRRSPSRRERSPPRHRSSRSTNSTVTEKTSNRNRSPRRDRSRSPESRSPVREKPSIRKKSPPRRRSISPSSASPIRERPSNRTRSPKRSNSKSPDSRSPSPKTKRLKRAQAEREAEKGSERENQRTHGKRGDRASNRERDSEKEVANERRERRSGRDGVDNVSSRSKRDHTVSPPNYRHRSRHRSRSPHAADKRARDEGINASIFFFAINETNSRGSDHRNGENDSVAKMKATESALESKEKEKPSFELSGKLAAETNRYRGVTLLFTEPPDARKPDIRWRLYVFKGGEPLNEPLYVHRQSCYLFGRERRVADVPTDHPSCSKQHAVLQYRQVEKENPDGTVSKIVKPYIMDLGSTNGTFINDDRIEAQKYYELFEKDTIKFGNSSREYVLLHENSAG